MAKHMMILSSSNKELIEQLIEEDIPTFVENSIDMIDNGDDTSNIPVYANLLMDQLKNADMTEVNSFFIKIIDHMNSDLKDEAKVDLVLLKNFVGEIEVIYN